MNLSSNQLILARFSIAIVCFSLFFSTYSLILTFSSVKSTGLLIVNSHGASNVIALGGKNKETKIIGRGKTRVRLEPGKYNLSLSNKGYFSSSVVLILKGQTTSKEISLPAAASSDNSDQVFNSLPFLGPNSQYKVDESLDITKNGSTPIIKITSADNSSKNLALNWIKSLGYEPKDYVIKYQTAPLTNYHYVDSLP